MPRRPASRTHTDKGAGPASPARGAGSAVDGLWVARDSKDLSRPAALFPARAARTSEPIIEIVLRVDAYACDALGALSGEALFASGRREEFRAEGNALRLKADGSGDVVASTNHPRVTYVGRFGVDPHTAELRLYWQRVQLRAGGGEAAASPVFASVTRERRSERYRTLSLHCRVDPALAETPHLASVLDAFACGPEIARCLRVAPPSPRERRPPQVEAILEHAGIAVATDVASARHGEGGERLRAMVNELKTLPEADVQALDQLHAWSAAELDEALQAASGAGNDALTDPWDGVLIFAPRFAERQRIVGTMFSTARQPRRGCALFVEPAGDVAWTAGDRSRALGFCAIHELGHLFNLLHSFEADSTQHRRQRRQPEAATFMNYPNRFPFSAAVAPDAEDGCRALFWSQFDHRFGPDELAHLRHGRNAATRPGQAIEALMSDAGAPPAEGPRGLAEAAAGDFTLDALSAHDPDLLDWLAAGDAKGPKDQGGSTWRLHLPARHGLGEPVIGWLEVHNATVRPCLVPEDLDPSSRLISVEITPPSGVPEHFEPARRDCGAGWSWLAPGESRRRALQLSFGATVWFTRPGPYRVVVRAPDPLGGERPIARHDLVVDPPARGSTAGLDRLWADDRVGLALLREGAAPAAAFAGLVAVETELPAPWPALVERHRSWGAVDAAASARDFEGAVARLHRRIVGDLRTDPFGARRSGATAELRDLAKAVLRRDDMPALVVGRLARRAARSALTLTRGDPEANSTGRRTLAAVGAVAERVERDRPNNG